MNILFPLVPAFFSTACIYAMAGFGGGSTYLALLVIANVPYQQIPKIALVCNVVVAAGGVYHFAREGHLRLGRVLPFVVTSIPMAYLGGRIPIDRNLFLLLLAISLFAAGLRLLFIGAEGPAIASPSSKNSWGIGGLAGAGLGFLSGLVGIGGGIFLSPLLYFIRWGGAREIAACASFFILVNSLSGLGGQFAQSGAMASIPWILPLAAAAFVGGQIGSRLSIRRLSLISLQRITATLMLLVAVHVLGTLL